MLLSSMRGQRKEGRLLRGGSVHYLAMPSTARDHPLKEHKSVRLERDQGEGAPLVASRDTCPFMDASQQTLAKLNMARCATRVFCWTARLHDVFAGSWGALSNVLSSVSSSILERTPAVVGGLHTLEDVDHWNVH